MLYINVVEDDYIPEDLLVLSGQLRQENSKRYCNIGSELGSLKP